VYLISTSASFHIYMYVHQ